MRTLLLCFVCFSIVFFYTDESRAQLSGTKTIPGDYASVSSAVTALNAAGVGAGGVTFNIADGHDEQNVNMTINITSNPPTASKPVVFQHSGTGTTPQIWAPFAGLGTINTSSLGGWGDAFIKIVGNDYITFDGIQFYDQYNGAGQTLSVEYGIMLLRNSSTDGTNHITVKNCNFGVLTDFQYHICIYQSNMNGSGTVTNPSTTGGLHEYNKFYSNNLGYWNGIFLKGYNAPSPYSLYDRYNEIGVDGGNNIFLNASNAVTYGVYAIYQNNLEVANNSIDDAGIFTDDVYGIYCGTSYNSAIDIYNNHISLAASGANNFYGIANYSGASGTANTVRIYNNTVENCTHTGSTTGNANYIYHYADCQNLQIYGNNISNNTYGDNSSSASGDVYYIYASADVGSSVGTWSIYNDTISNNSRLRSGSTSNYTAGISVETDFDVSSCSVYQNIISNNKWKGNDVRCILFFLNSFTINCYNNTISNDTMEYSGGTMWGICDRNLSTGSSASFSYNTINNLIGTGSATIYGIFSTNASMYYNTIHTLNSSGGPVQGLHLSNYNSEAHDNIIYSLSTTSDNSTGIHANTVDNLYLYKNTVYSISCNSGYSYGIYSSYSGLEYIYKNNIYDISATSGSSRGIELFADTTTYLYLNFISEIKATTSTDSIAAVGININKCTDNYISYNTIYLNASPGNLFSSFGTSGIYATTTSTMIDLRNNIIVNKSTHGLSGGKTVAYRRSSVYLTNYLSSSNNNNFYAGTPAAGKLIFYDGTNSDQTISAFKSRVIPRDSNSFSENSPFTNTTTSPYNLHLSTSAESRCESGGIVVASPLAISVDYDNNARYPNAGYPNNPSYPATAPDAGADEYAGVPSAGPTFSYAALTKTSNMTNRSLSAVYAYDYTGVNTTTSKPRCYYRKTINTNTYNDNTSATDGWKYVESNASANPHDFTIDYSKLYGGAGVASGDVIEYFVIAEDLQATPAVGYNSVTFTYSPSGVNLTSSDFPVNGTINSYKIVPAYSGTYSAGTATAFPSLTKTGGFFEKINDGVVTGNVILEVTTDMTEDGTNPLNEIFEEGGSGFTILIKPSSAAPRLISGATGSAMIRLNGSDRLTINGSFSGTGNYLTFRNTSGVYPTLKFLNDAKNNIVTNCTIESNNSNTIPADAGTINFGTTTGTQGNDSNTISFCEIRDRSDAIGYPLNAIYASGTTSGSTLYNSSVSILSNKIYNFYTTGGLNMQGVYVGDGNTSWIISGNSFYLTSPKINNSAGLFWNVIMIESPGGDNYSILNNYIGGTGPNCSGGQWAVSGNNSKGFWGIFFKTSASTNSSSIQGNLISKVKITGTAVAAPNPLAGFKGIAVQSGKVNIGDVSANTIGSVTDSNSIICEHLSSTVDYNVIGIDVNSPGGTIQNNQIGGFALNNDSPNLMSIIGINIGNGMNSALTISGNKIGSTAIPNSFRNTGGATNPVRMCGIYSTASGAGTAVTISNNTISNITNSSTVSYYLSVSSGTYGIFHFGPARPLINDNIVYNISTTVPLVAGAVSNCSVGGIITYSATLAQSVSRNQIYNIANLNTGVTSTSVSGIGIDNNSAGDIDRNKIYGLVNKSTGLTTTINGIEIENISNLSGWTISNNQVSINNSSSVYLFPIIINDERNHLFLSDKTKTITNRSTVMEEQADSLSKNDAIIRGIRTNTATAGNIYIYYNSIYIGGLIAAGTNSSSCYWRTISGPNNTLKNNLFCNDRTGGTGRHYAQYIQGAAGTYTSEYNAYVIADTLLSVGNWGGVNYGLTDWRTASAGDKKTWCVPAISLLPVNLFVDFAVGNLDIKAGNQEAWIVSGKGIQIVTINNDYAGNPRPTVLAGGCPDIGSDEFIATSLIMPPSSSSGVPGAGVTTSHYLLGRKICDIKWLGAGTFPTDVSIKYYSGKNPPATAGIHSNSYWEITPIGPYSGINYEITFYFLDNETYNITLPNLNTILAKNDGSGWNEYFLGAAPLQSQLNWANLTVKVTGLATFSKFTLGDNNYPFPSDLNLTVIPSGFYNTASNSLNSRDTVKVYLRDAAYPFAIVDSAASYIDSITFNGLFKFTKSNAGNYYIVIKHRNSLDTWSKTGGESFTAGIVQYYNITTDSAKAYGNNLVKSGTNWCIINGDCNQDGYIDGSDYLEVINHYDESGYLVGDTNGDWYVDGSDYLSIINNYDMGVVSPLPPMKKVGKNNFKRNGSAPKK